MWISLKKRPRNTPKPLEGKDEARNLNLQLDTGTNETVSAAQKVKDKMAAKSSAFGKLVGGVVDRRNK